jgi:hypothetical protein
MAGVETLEPTAEHPPNRVISQSVAPGTSLVAGTPIDFTISTAIVTEQPPDQPQTPPEGNNQGATTDDDDNNNNNDYDDNNIDDDGNNDDDIVHAPITRLLSFPRPASISDDGVYNVVLRRRDLPDGDWFTESAAQLTYANFPWVVPVTGLGRIDFELHVNGVPAFSILEENFE